MKYDSYNLNVLYECADLSTWFNLLITHNIFVADGYTKRYKPENVRPK